MTNNDGTGYRWSVLVGNEPAILIDADRQF